MEIKVPTQEQFDEIAAAFSYRRPKKASVPMIGDRGVHVKLPADFGQSYVRMRDAVRYEGEPSVERCAGGYTWPYPE